MGHDVDPFEEAIESIEERKEQLLKLSKKNYDVVTNATLLLILEELSYIRAAIHIFHQDWRKR